MNFQQKLENYSELALKFGVNVQTGQDLVISGSVENADFIRITVKKAYELGTRKVHVYWIDEETTLIELMNAPSEALGEAPQWIPDSLSHLADEKAAFLFVQSTSPFMYEEVQPERMNIYRQARAQANEEFADKYISRQWCIISVPSRKWASAVFPDMSPEQAVDELWSRIFDAVRLDAEHPVTAWKNHLKQLREKFEHLNARHYKRLHYRGPGTNLSVELPAKHLWVSADKITEDGIYCCVNMPTEEVFTTPTKHGINGTIRNTKPLNYDGNIIDNFSLTFKDGRIVNFSAEEGEDLLRGLIEIDEGSHYLGEIALVPHRSPISDLNILFYNTLFDENASCHVAIGDGLPMCIEGEFQLTRAEMQAEGANDSLIHVDFMVGSQELDIDGELEDGSIEPIFRQGAWAF